MRQIFEYHPSIGHTFVPGLRARIEHENGGYIVHTNSSGFRCEREFEPRRTPGFRRVLIFGDSFTAGDGVSNRYRWTDLLEQKVPQLEAYNFGLPGTGTDQQYLAYREFATGIEHDLLIIAILVENIRRIVSRYREYQDENGNRVIYAKPYYILADGRLVLHNVPVTKQPIPPDQAGEEEEHVYSGGRFALARRWVNRLGMRDLLQHLTRYQPVPEYDQPGNPAWILMRSLLGRWIAEHPGPVLLFPIPLNPFVEQTSDPSAYRARFRELAEEARCLLHDPLADLLEYSAEERRAFRHEVDVHPTISGHLALADSLAPVLARALSSSMVRTES